MAREGIPSAVLLDALGTLVELERPWPHLVARAGGARRRGRPRTTRAAMLAEMAYYRAHHDEARDWAGLKDLRRRCAAVVQERWAPSLPLADVEDALLAAMRFRAYPEVPAVLARLRAGGARLAVVSQLGRLAARRPRAHRAARRCVDAVVISAELGAAKPDPAIFRAALERAGRPRRARRCTSATASSTTSPARARRASRRCSSPATAPQAPAGVRVVASLDGLLDDVGHTGRLVLCIRARMSTAPSSIPPPSFDVAPELPDGVERRRRPEPRAGSRGWRGSALVAGLRRRAHRGARHRRHRRRRAARASPTPARR